MFIYRYFSDGFQAIEHFGTYIAELSSKVTVIRQIQDDEKTDLIEVRNSLKNSPGLEKLVRNVLITMHVLIQTIVKLISMKITIVAHHLIYSLIQFNFTIPASAVYIAFCYNIHLYIATIMLSTMQFI